MNDKRILIDCLLHRKRIDFSSDNYFKHLKTAFLFLFSIAMLSSFYVIFSYGLTYPALLICFGIIVASLTIYYPLKRTRTTSIKGDTLIMNDINNQSCVTSIRSIRKVKTTRFLGLYKTEITFHLDGLKQTVLFYNLTSSLPATPETSLKRALKISHLNRTTAKTQIIQLERTKELERAKIEQEEKQKANHKPDPVAFQ